MTSVVQWAHHLTGCNGGGLFGPPPQTTQKTIYYYPGIHAFGALESLVAPWPFAGGHRMHHEFGKESSQKRSTDSDSWPEYSSSSCYKFSSICFQHGIFIELLGPPSPSPQVSFIDIDSLLTGPYVFLISFFYFPRNWHQQVRSDNHSQHSAQYCILWTLWHSLWHDMFT